MNLIKIAFSNIRSKPQNTFLSVILLAFGVGIISLLLLVENQLTEKFNRNIKDIDFVLAAKGSPLQSILANVYHVDAPTGNISIEESRRIVKDIMVAEAIPLAYGDNFESWRIVGTNQKYPDHYGVKLKEGKPFEKAFEACVGSEVAKRTGLKVGDTFTSLHGLDNKQAVEEDGHSHDTKYTVTGIYETSESVIDNLLLTPVQSVWLIHEHEEEHADVEPAAAAEEHVHVEGEEHNHDHAEEHDHVHAEGEAHDHDHDHAHDHDHDHAHDHDHSTMTYEELAAEPGREITAYLIKKRNKGAIGQLSKKVEGTAMQLANPAIEANRLNQNFGLGMDTMKAIALLIMMLSFVSVFISLYNSLKERRYELALMRTMGGSRFSLFSLILLEGLALTFIGALVGLILSRLGLWVLSYFAEKNFHYNLVDMRILPEEWILISVTLGVGILASLLPAVKALRIDISKTLSHA
jgi:putative ABC transport system permease protein